MVKYCLTCTSKQGLEWFSFPVPHTYNELKRTKGQIVKAAACNGGVKLKCSERGGAKVGLYITGYNKHNS